MKKLLIALICTVIGFSASANDLTPKRGMPAEAKAEVVAPLNTNRVETGNFAKSPMSLFRRQMNFTFTTACGYDIIVYVSGPSSASNLSLWQTAWAHFQHDFQMPCHVSSGYSK